MVNSGRYFKFYISVIITIFMINFVAQAQKRSEDTHAEEISSEISETESLLPKALDSRDSRSVSDSALSNSANSDESVKKRSISPSGYSNASSVSDLSGAGDVSKENLDKNMHNLLRRIKAVLSVEEKNLSTEISSFRQSDNRPSFDSVNGSEDHHALSERIRAVSNLTTKAEAWCKIVQRESSSSSIGSGPVHVHGHKGFLKGATKLRQETVIKLTEIMDSLKRSSSDNKVVMWNETLVKIKILMDRFTEKIKELEEAEEIKNCQHLLEDIKKEMPYIETLFAKKNLNADEIEKIEAHFKKLASVQTIIKFMAKTLKYTGWVIFGCQQVPHLTVMSVASSAAVAAAAAKVAPWIASIAIISSLAYEIFSVYQRARIDQVITNKNILFAMKSVFWSDMKIAAKWLKNFPVKSLTIVSESLNKFYLAIDSKEMREIRKKYIEEKNQTYTSLIDTLDELKITINGFEPGSLKNFRNNEDYDQSYIQMNRDNFFAEIQAQNPQTIIAQRIQNALVILIREKTNILKASRKHISIYQLLIDLSEIILKLKVKSSADEEIGLAIKEFVAWYNKKNGEFSVATSTPLSAPAKGLSKKSSESRKLGSKEAPF